jgi:hypothetical protein
VPRNQVEFIDNQPFLKQTQRWWMQESTTTDLGLSVTQRMHCEEHYVTGSALGVCECQET